MPDEPTLGVTDLPMLVGELTAEVRNLTKAHRRKRVSDAMLAGVVVMLGVFVLLYYFVELPDRRDAIQNQIGDLACTGVRLRPPGFSATYDKIRRDYHCPPYNPADAPDVNSPSAAPRTRVVPGPTVTAPARPGPTVTRTPTAGAAPRAVTRTATATVTAPAPPAKTRTVVRSRTVTVTATPTCVVLHLICR